VESSVNSAENPSSFLLTKMALNMFFLFDGGAY